MTPEETSHIEDILRRDGLKPDEVRRVMSKIVEGVSPQYEDGPCRHCDGYGFIMVPACMGGTRESCYHCYGNGRTTRIKVPA
jgi:DnaJ-class molecular chaperone